MATSEAHKPIKISSPPGPSIVLMAGPLGKVYLSQMNDAEVSRIVKKHKLPQFTNASKMKKLSEVDKELSVAYKNKKDLGETTESPILEIVLLKSIQKAMIQNFLRIKSSKI